jgi:regulator of extracellular matrix RemA (YlzA/DUF370 family)
MTASTGPSGDETGVKSILAIVPRVVAPSTPTAIASAAQLSTVLVDAIRERRQRAVLEVAEESIADLTPEQFLQRLVDDERLTMLFNKAVRAAVETPAEAKRRAMGRVVGAALKDDAEIDQLALIMEALIDLEAPHFATLARIKAAATFGEGAVFATKAGDAVEAGLRRHGLVADMGAGSRAMGTPPQPDPVLPDAGIGVTDVGTALLRLVSQSSPRWPGQDWASQ